MNKLTNGTRTFSESLQTSARSTSLILYEVTFHANFTSVGRDPKPAPLAVFAAEFSSAENPPQKPRLAEYAMRSRISAESSHHVCFVHCMTRLTSAAFQKKMKVVSRISAVFLFIAIIRLSRISAEISFQPAVIL